MKDIRNYRELEILMTYFKRLMTKLRTLMTYFTKLTTLAGKKLEITANRRYL